MTLSIHHVPMALAARLADVIREDLSELDPNGDESCFEDHRQVLREFSAYCAAAAGQQSLPIEEVSQ